MGYTRPPTYVVAMRSLEKLNLDEARLLAANLVQELLYYLKINKSAWEYLRNIGMKHLETNDAEFLYSINLRISFWDTDYLEQPQPYVAEILLINNKLLYGQVDKGKHYLRLLYQEPYTEALTLLNKGQEEKKSLNDSKTTM